MFPQSLFQQFLSHYRNQEIFKLYSIAYAKFRPTFLIALLPFYIVAALNEGDRAIMHI